MKQTTVDRVARAVYAAIFGGGVLVAVGLVVVGVVGVVVFHQLSERAWMVLPIVLGTLLGLGSLDRLKFVLHHNDLPD